MKQPKISLSEQVKKAISYKDFAKQFGDYFVDSHEPRRQKAIEAEYEKLTGRKVVKVKSDESTGFKDNSDKAKGNNTSGDARATSGESKAE